MITRKQNIDFGIVLTLALLVAGAIGQISILHKIAIATLLIAAIMPGLYHPYSWLWFKVAKRIEIFFSVVILFMVFYLVVTPIGLLRRGLSKDHLQIQHFRKSSKSVFSKKKVTYKKEDLVNQF